MWLQFDNPSAFVLFAAVAILAALMLRNRARHPASFTWRRFWLALGGFSLLVLALARPQAGHQVAQKRALKGNLFLAIDISRSMVADDVPPNRLAFASAFALRVVQKLEGIRVAIYPFAQDGYLMTPLTSDTTVASEMLGVLGPNVTTAQGTDLSESLAGLFRQIVRMEEMARERGEDWAPTQVLLLSDGESQFPLRPDVMGLFRARSIPIFTVAVGTENGATISVDTRANGKSDFFRDPAGKTAVTKADPKTLRRVAELTGGDAFPAELALADRVSRRIAQTMQIGKLTATFKVDREFYPQLLLMALVLFAIEFSFGRWHYAIRSLLAVVSAGMLLSTSAVAADEGSASKSPARRAVEAYNSALIFSQNQQQLPQAVELLEESAQLAKDKTLKKKALYSLGNALLKMMDPAQAIAAYQRARDIESGDEEFEKDANRRISENISLAVEVEETLRAMAQKQQEQQQKQGEGEGKGDPKDPNGPQKDYQPQMFSEEQKKKMFDLMAGEEQQIQQRLMQDKQRKAQSKPTEKPW